MQNTIQKRDSIAHITKISIEKFADDEAVKAGKSYEKIDLPGNNILVNAGINVITTLIATGAGTDWSAAYIGVGDDDTAAAATQTDLQAVTNKLRKAMNGSYPTYGTAQKITFQSDFGADDANWAWKEFGVFSAESAGTMLNRKVSAQGTKTSGQTWRVSVEITFS